MLESPLGIHWYLYFIRDPIVVYTVYKSYEHTIRDACTEIEGPRNIGFGSQGNILSGGGVRGYPMTRLLPVRNEKDVA